MDLNLRRVHRSSIDFNLSLKGDEKTGLCDHCARNPECAMREGIERTTGTQTSVVVRDCESYWPPIGFRPPLLGFALGHVWNTFRISQTYAKILKVGDVVGLVDTTKDDVFGLAQVESVFVAPLGELLRDHAAGNHLMQNVTRDRAPEELHRVLRNLSGPRIADPERISTVIYLSTLRLDDELNKEHDDDE